MHTYDCCFVSHSVILQKPYFKHSTVLSELGKITSHEMLQHAKNLFKSFNTTCFIHGNLLKDKVCLRCKDYCCIYVCTYSIVKHTILYMCLCLCAHECMHACVCTQYTFVVHLIYAYMLKMWRVSLC